MSPTNRTIEEKLAIVQQIRSNSSDVTSVTPLDKSVKTTKYTSGIQNSQNHAQESGNTIFPIFLFIRIVLCLIIFGMIIFMESRYPQVKDYINAMITTEENGNIIDFMSPFTYTLQEGDESAPEEQEGKSVNTSEPSDKNELNEGL